MFQVFGFVMLELIQSIVSSLAAPAALVVITYTLIRQQTEPYRPLPKAKPQKLPKATVIDG